MTRLIASCQIILLVSYILVMIWLNYRFDVIFGKVDVHHAVISGKLDSGFGKMDAEFAKINADLDRIDAKLGITSDKIETK